MTWIYAALVGWLLFGAMCWTLAWWLGEVKMDRAPFYDQIKALLVQRGWTIDEKAQENMSGELWEFIHPETGEAMAWLDAVFAEMERELKGRGAA